MQISLGRNFSGVAWSAERVPAVWISKLKDLMVHNVL